MNLKTVLQEYLWKGEGNDFSLQTTSGAARGFGIVQGAQLDSGKNRATLVNRDRASPESQISQHNIRLDRKRLETEYPPAVNSPNITRYSSILHFSSAQ